MSFTLQPFPQITTTHLILRQATTADVRTLFFLRSDSEVMKYINRPKVEKMDEIHAFLEKIELETLANESILWAISLKPDSVMIGVISLWHFSSDLAKAEVGYSLNPEFHGRGIMTEALQSVLKFGFDELNFKQIEAFTNRRNMRSIQMLVRNGFVLVENGSDPDDPENVIFLISDPDMK